MKRVWIVENAVPVERLPYTPPFIENSGVRFLLNGSSWDETEVRNLCDAFCSDRHELTVVSSPAQMEAHLKSGAQPPHAVIFDWQGPGFDDTRNIAAIESLLQTTFSYVQVYTHAGADVVESLLAPLRSRYGGRLLTARAKGEVTPDSLLQQVSSAWAGSIAGETADGVRKRARAAVERLLNDLCGIRRTSLAAMFKGDANQFVSLVMAKLRDELGAGGVEELGAIIKGGGAAESDLELRRLLSSFYYYFPQDEFVRTGDIQIDGDGKLWLVVTPWCHLEDFRKKTAGWLTVVSACEMTPEALKAQGLSSDRIGASVTAPHGTAGPSIVVLPNVPTKENQRADLSDLVLITHSWHSRAIKSAGGALRYTDAVGAKRICTLTDTFSGAVMSHLAKTISSVGIPDFPKFEVERLSALIKT